MKNLKIIFFFSLYLLNINVMALNISSDALYSDDELFFEKIGKLRWNATSMEKDVVDGDNLISLELYHYDKRIASIYKRTRENNKIIKYVSYHFDENNVCYATTEWDRECSYTFRKIGGELVYYKIQNDEYSIVNISIEERNRILQGLKTELTKILLNFPGYSCSINW